MTNPARTKYSKASLHGSFDRKRLGVISAILVGACVLPATGASAAGCDPGPEEVSFFQHSFYRGACSVLGIGRYANSKAMRIRNDSISSIRVGTQVNVTVCKHGSNQKTSIYNTLKKNRQICQTFKKSIGSFKKQKIGNDSISKAFVFKPIKNNSIKYGRCKPLRNQLAVAVYQNPSYTGICKSLGIGYYKNSKEMNFKNDSISSIEFGYLPKVRIIVCQHSNFKGRCENMTESITGLHKSKIGDNQITSIRVLLK